MPIDFLDGVTIDIEKISDYHEIMNTTFKEKLDSRICEIILQSDNNLITNEMKEDFKKKIVDNLDEKGILEHRYYQQNGLGRLFIENENGKSFVLHDKFIYKSEPLYKDIIYKNSNLVVFDITLFGLSTICQVMKLFKKKIPIINLLYNNFDGFIETIKTFYQKEGDLNRTCIKALIYDYFKDENYLFSDWVKYLQDKNIYIKNSKKIHPLLSAYMKEINFVRKIIYENNSKLALFLQDKKLFEPYSPYYSIEISNIKEKVLTSWKRIIETEIISNLYNFLTKENIIKNNFCTIFGDSIIFPDVECDKDILIKNVQKYIKIKTCFEFNFKLKKLEVNKKSDINDNEDHDDDEDKVVNPWNDIDAIYKHPIGKGTIFVGNKIAAENLSLLKQLKVTRVINCTFDNLSVPNFHEKHFKYYNFAIRNWNKYITSANSTILEFIYPVFRFIDTAIEKGENVLVHSYLGAHRAGTLATACLMYYENLDVASAISKAKTLRPIINPTGNLKKFLYKFEFDKNHKNGNMNYEDDDEPDEDEQEDGEYEDREDDEDDPE